MSDYTPTTEEVKANFAFVGDDEVVNTINEQKFDRWLAQNNAEVAKDTEQRIIKLIEDPTTMNYWWGMPDKNIGIYGNLAKYLIALIKGENK